MAPFGAVRHDQEQLSNPYQTRDLCPANLCPMRETWVDERFGLKSSVDSGTVCERMPEMFKLGLEQLLRADILVLGGVQQARWKEGEHK